MIDFVDLQAEFEQIDDEVQEAIRSVLASQRFVQGPECSRFERRFAAYVGTDHAIGVNSGSDALRIALGSLDIGVGDEVILPSHTFVATANAVVHAGADPVFVDIDPATYCLDPDAVRDGVTDRTTAIIPVHLYGQPADMQPILDIASDNDLFVVEDAAQAHGATYDEKSVGSFGDIGCFSFYPSKNLGAYGDAGAIVTENDNLAARIAKVRNQGESKKYYHDHLGYNSRLDELQAAILNVKLDYLDTWNSRRREIASVYEDLLTSVTTPVQHHDTRHVYHLYVIRTNKRDELKSHLADQGVHTLIHYPIPVHEQRYYKERYSARLPTTERIVDKILSLPMHPFLDRHDIAQITRSVNDFAQTRE